MAPTPRLRYHNFGGTLSGPVMIPKFGEGPSKDAYWSGSDKTFFFFSEERGASRAASRNQQSSSQSCRALGQLLFGARPSSVPHERGDARKLHDARRRHFTATPLLVQDTNGSTIQARAGMVFRADNRAYAGNIIPTSDFDPRALALLDTYPLPNTGTNQFNFSPINALRTRQESVRIDHNFNDNHRLFGRYTHDLNVTQEPGGLFANTTLPNITTTDTRIPGMTFVGSLTSVINPTVVNEATYNFSSKLHWLEGRRPRPQVGLPGRRLNPRGLS